MVRIKLERRWFSGGWMRRGRDGEYRPAKWCRHKHKTEKAALDCASDAVGVGGRVFALPILSYRSTNTKRSKKIRAMLRNMCAA